VFIGLFREWTLMLRKNYPCCVCGRRKRRNS